MTDHTSVPVARIIIADDHYLFRSALVDVLMNQSTFEVIAEATNGQEALQLCRRLKPDLVVMDVRMPKMDGLQATREIKGELPLTIVLILTSFEDPQYLAEAINAGA